MPSSVRWLLALGGPFVVAVFFELPYDASVAKEEPFFVFLVFWALLWFQKYWAGGRQDLDTYGGFLPAALTVVTLMGSAWGLLGLVLDHGTAEGRASFADRPFYWGIFWAGLVAVLALPRVFTRRTPRLARPGPIEDPASPMLSHDEPPKSAKKNASKSGFAEFP